MRSDLWQRTLAVTGGIGGVMSISPFTDRSRHQRMPWGRSSKVADWIYHEERRPLYPASGSGSFERA